METNVLLERYRKGEEEVFTEILKEYQGMIYSILSRFNRRLGDYTVTTDDLYQEACLGLLDACRNYDDVKGMKFSSFAYLVIHRRVSKRYFSLRRVYSHETSSLDSDDYASRKRSYINDQVTMPEYEYRKEENSTEMKRFIEKLGDEDRMILRMRMEKKGYKEIAESLKIPSKRVDNRMSLIRKRYRQMNSSN